MKIRLTMVFCSFLLILLWPICGFAQIDSAGKLYESLSKSVVRLEYIQTELHGAKQIPDSNRVPDGTGFIVEHNAICYMVAARHVAEAPHPLIARVTFRGPETNEYQILQLYIPHEAWIYHPIDKSDSIRYVDVAVAQMPKAISGKVYSRLQESLLKSSDPVPPTSILVFGFPFELGFKLKFQKPLARSGIIALGTNEPFIVVDGQYAESKCILIDAPIYPGNSGSPFFSNREIYGKLTLLGLIIATNNKLNYAVGEPVSRIMECLDYAEKNPKPENMKAYWLSK
jgi:hypothetical protein